MAAMLRSGQMPMPMPPPAPVEDPNALTLAALARAGLLGSGPAVSPMPPTLMEEARAPQQAPMQQPPGGPIDYSNAGMSGARPLAEATPAGAGPLGVKPDAAMPPMPPTLSGMENPREITREPFRPRGRVLANIGGAVAGGAGGGAIGGPIGAVAGAGAGSAGAGQIYDAAADYLMGTQERAPIMSGQTARDAAVGAIPAAGPATRAASAAVARHPTLASMLAAGGFAVAAPSSADDRPAPGALVQQTSERLAERRRQLKKLEDGAAANKINSEFFRGLDRRDRAAVQKAQEMLQGAGLYLDAGDGPNRRKLAVDGIWGRGMGEAVAEYQRRLQDEAKATQRNITAANADIERLDATLIGHKRDTALEQAEARMPGWQKAVRDYATPVGVAAGMAVAPATRGAVTWAANRAGRRAADQANDLLGAGAANTPARVAGVNEFYTRGGGQRPFNIEPTAPRGFVPAAGQTSANELYPPASTIWRGADTARMTAAGGGAGLAEYRLAVAREELERARQDAQQNPSDSTFAALHKAQTNVGLLTAAARASETSLLAYPTTSAVVRYQNTRPDVNRGEAEVLRLNRISGQQRQWGPHQPGVTSYRNPATGEVRSLDDHGRWRGPRPNGGQGWTREPPVTWDRISSRSRGGPGSVG